MKILPLPQYQNIHFIVRPKDSGFMYIEGAIYYLKDRQIIEDEVCWLCFEKDISDKEGSPHKEHDINDYFKTGKWIKVKKENNQNTYKTINKSYEKFL